MLLIIISSIFYLVSGESVIYDSFYGRKATDEELAQFAASNITESCTNNITIPCDPQETRRWDGSCNNLQNPSGGAAFTPYYRFLPPVWAENTDYQPRLSEKGEPLTPCRHIRVNLLSEGRVPDLVFTQLSTHFMVFMATDITGTRDTSNFVTTRPYCCLPEGKNDPMCAPSPVRDDDPVFRYSNIRCLNMTRPITFQTTGCIAAGSSPERIVSATPIFDLSPVYGDKEELARRNFTGGLLNVDIINGREWPPTRSTNLLLGVNFFGIIWFWRYHNFLARQLAVQNPCWTDNQLFFAARDINIATANQIHYYELLPLMMGSELLLKDGILTSDPQFRDIYDEKVVPQMALEYPLVLRWLHMMQDGFLNFYDNQGHYLRQFPIVNLTSRVDVLSDGDNIEYITQGCFRQASAKLDDYIVDPDIVGNGLGPIQRATDIMTNDLAKFRYSGIQPYVKYREMCFGETYSSFDDLADLIDQERLEILKELYESVNDIDLLAGLWVEKHTVGHVPPTFYCLVSRQLKRNIVSDRHWYERPNRPNAFTTEQLLEIRKSSAARMLCDIGDGVTDIQPNAFQREGPSNVIGPCSSIAKIDFSHWKDPQCAAA